MHTRCHINKYIVFLNHAEDFNSVIHLIIFSMINYLLFLLDSALKYMPLVSLTVFMAAYSIGFGPIAWLLMGEIIPVRARGNSAGFSTAFNLLLVFLVTSVFNTMMVSL